MFLSIFHHKQSLKCGAGGALETDGGGERGVDWSTSCTTCTSKGARGGTSPATRNGSLETTAYNVTSTGPPATTPITRFSIDRLCFADKTSEIMSDEALACSGALPASLLPRLLRTVTLKRWWWWAGGKVKRCLGGGGGAHPH